MNYRISMPKSKFEEDLNEMERAYRRYQAGENVLPEIDNNKFIPAFLFELAKEVSKIRHKLEHQQEAINSLNERNRSY